jgi:hypothetical protein
MNMNYHSSELADQCKDINVRLASSFFHVCNLLQPSAVTHQSYTACVLHIEYACSVFTNLKS